MVPLSAGDRVVSSQLVEIEAFRAVDRERLLGNLASRSASPSCAKHRHRHPPNAAFLQADIASAKGLWRDYKSGKKQER